MKKIMLLLWVLMSMSMIAQDVGFFDVYQLKIVENETGQISKSISTNLTIQVTNETLTLIGKIAMVWKFSGSIRNSTSTSFYSYAYDQEGVRCRIWFKAYDEVECAFGIEYSDYSFLYLCTYR